MLPVLDLDPVLGPKQARTDLSTKFKVKRCAV
jgi:hypothetical protein